MIQPDVPDAVPADARAPYTPPVLEPLGTWSALTLQQSIVISGVFLPDAEPKT